MTVGEQIGTTPSEAIDCGRNRPGFTITHTRTGGE
jgi:hypothetical protein